MDKSLYKGIPHQSSLLDFDKYIVHSSTNKSQLFSLIRDCQIDSLKIRCDVWRLCLGIVSIDATFEEKAEQLQNERNRYQELLNKHVRKGQVEPVDSGNGNGNGNGKESVMIGKNPLGKLLVATKPAVVITKEQQDDKFLQEEVRKDVERTYQQRQFFKNIEIIKILSRVLFVWSRQFPDISYKQGMNQVGASMIWVYFQSCIDPNTSHKDLEGITQQLQQKYLFFHSNQHAQADIYSLFDRMMNSNHKQMFRSQTENNKQINPNSKNNSPILQRIIKLSDIKFKIIDGELFRHIKLNEVAMRPFLLKWIRCIHTREFELEESFALWDNIFLAYHLEPQGGMYFIDCTTLAMLVYLRDIALKKDARFEIVQLYQKYPKIKGKQLQEVVNLAWTVKGCLENGGAGKEAEKKKELEFRQDVIGEFKVYGEEEYKSEKAMMEEKQKRERQERAQANNLTKQPSVEQQKVEKKEVSSPMMEKSSSFMSQKAIIPKTQSNEPQQSSASQQPKPSQQPPTVIQQHKSPKPNPNPILLIQQRKNSQKVSQPTAQKKTPPPPKPSQQKPIPKQSPPPPPPAPPAPKPLNYTITFNHTQWKQIQELMKKSIEENTDLESRSLTMKVMKIFASKGQQEAKRLQSIEEQQ